MSTTMSSLTCSDPYPCLNQQHPRLCQSQSPVFTSCCVLMIKHRYPITGSQKLHQFNIPYKFSASNRAMKAMGESDNFEPEAPVPSPKPSSPAWRKWMVGIVLSILLPSFRHRWGPLLVLQNKVDEAIETVETVTEIAQDLAEDVEKLADEVGDKVPEDTKLKEAVETIENLAEEAVKETQRVKERIHKVQEAEKEVEERILGIEMEKKELVKHKR